jgi:hypothetical protein
MPIPRMDDLVFLSPGTIAHLKAKRRFIPNTHTVRHASPGAQAAVSQSHSAPCEAPPEPKVVLREFGSVIHIVQSLTRSHRSIISGKRPDALGKSS